MAKKILLILLIPILGIFLFPHKTTADSPDPYSKQDGFNSGMVSGTFNPNIVKNWAIPVYPAAPPVIANNSIYYLDYQPGRPDSYIKSKNIYSEATWSYPLSLTVNSSKCPPVYAEGLIYSCDNDLIVLDPASGRLVKIFNSGSKKFQRVVSANNLILGFTDNNYIYAFDKISGLVVWTRQIDKIPFGAVVAAEGKIVFNATPYDGQTVALNSLNGLVAWKNNIPGMVGDLTYSPATKRFYDSARKWSIDIADGTMRAADTGMGWPFVVNNQLISYYQNGVNIDFVVRYADTGGLIGYKNGVVKNESIGSKPVMVDGKIYILTHQNRLLQFDLAGNCLNPTASKLDSFDNFQGQIIIDHGRLFTYNTRYQEIGYYDLAKVVTSSPETIHLISPYNIGTNHQHLGQLHSHIEPETQLDGLKLFLDPPTIFEVETRYKNAGYDFVGLTEHNKILLNPMVAGLTHIVDSEEITQDPGGDHILALGIQSLIQPTGSDQSRIDQVVAQDGVPILAHPNSTDYPFTATTLNFLTRYNLLEVDNNSINRLNYFKKWGNGLAFDKWDGLLSRGKTIFGTADDDYTPYDGGFDGAAVEVFAASNSQADILVALKAGNFYALQGSGAPRISNIVVGSEAIIISVSEPSDITFIGKGGQKLQTQNGVTAFSYNPKGAEIYVRVEVKSSQSGKYAWTQPITIKNPSQSTTNVAGTFTIPLTQGRLKSVATDTVTARVADQDEYPENLPLLGYFSPIYDFSTNGQVLDGTQLTISYNPADLPVARSNLSIYSYNETEGIWGKVASVVDAVNNTVSANLAHFSKYTLSAEVPDDVQAPEVSLTAPTDLQNLSGAVNLTAEAADDQAVTSVSFTVDDKLLETDSFGQDGWSTIINTANFTSGSHKLTLSAEDFSGNIGKKDYQINISGGVSVPTINLATPTTGEYVYDPSSVSGSYTSDIPVQEIGIYLDGVFLDNADLDSASKTYTKTISWNQFKEGNHTLKVVFSDQKGNSATAEREVNIGQNISAKILSPLNTQYLRGGSVELQVEIVPTSAPVKIYVDGKETTNNTVLDLLQYSIGKHSVEVKFQDKLLASTEFTITTSYVDTIKIVNRLYKEGHIKNFGIANAINVQLSVAQLLDLFRLNRLSDLMLGNIKSSIIQQTQLKKPGIDSYAKEILISNISYLKQ